jgi:hypothetical protein
VTTYKERPTGRSGKTPPAWWDTPDVIAIDEDFVLGPAVLAQPGVWVLAHEPWDGGRPPCYVRLSVAESGRLVPTGVYVGLEVTTKRSAGAVRVPSGVWSVRQSGRELRSDDLRGVSLNRVLKAIPHRSSIAEAARKGGLAVAGSRPGRRGHALAEHETFAARATELAKVEPISFTTTLATELDVDVSTVYRRLAKCRELGVSVPDTRRPPRGGPR